VASHITADHDPASMQGLMEAYRGGGVSVQTRTAEEFGRLFLSGLELVAPGVVDAAECGRTQQAPARVGGSERLRRGRPQADVAASPPPRLKPTAQGPVVSRRTALEARLASSWSSSPSRSPSGERAADDGQAAMDGPLERLG
jgi:hypothetical protein